VSKPFRCPACNRRIRRAPYFTVQDKRTRRITAYHGHPCAESGLAEADRLGPSEATLRFIHPRSWGDAKGGLRCRGGCFAASLGESTAQEDAA